MNREKQIEEIAKIIIMYDSVNSTEEDIVRCANHIYNKGYRKQLEGEWVKDEKSRTLHRCSKCGYGSYYNGVRLGNFCCNCGARMKNGGVMIE